MINISSNTSSLICEIAKNEQFFECYKYFLINNLTESILSWLLIFSTIFANLIVIILIHRNSDKITLFDQILINHCLLDGLTGLVGIPFYHINSIFGYWPFSSLTATLWSIFDTSKITVSNLNMLYLSWSRLRSIQNPTAYTNEFIFKQSIYLIISIWLISFIIWTAIVLNSGLKVNSLILNIDGTYQMFIFEILFWLLPLLFIIVVSIIIFYYLKLRQNMRNQRRLEQNRQQNNNNNNNNKSLFENIFKIKFGSHTLFTIIMSVYIIQWLIPFTFELLIFNSTIIQIQFIDCMYWLTYTVCLTDAIILVFFNSNVSPFKANTTPNTVTTTSRRNQNRN
jgi:hypothetical protein